MSESLAGRVALVTGGSRGLGREMVLAFAAAGADVVIASRKLEGCEALAAEVRDTYGRRAIPYAANVGRWEELPQLVDAAFDRLGHVDILVNNAGMSPLYEDLGSVSEALFDKVLDVNLKAPFRLTSLIAPRMAAAGRGSIINISSIASERSRPESLPYAAAKAGLNALTAGFAIAYGPSVRVNTILAGPFFTDIADAWDRPAFDAYAKAFPLQRGGHPHEIVGAALHLAGDSSSFTTGAVLRVDGGSSLVY